MTFKVAEKLTKANLSKPVDGEGPDRSKSHFKEDILIPKLFRTRPQDYVGSGYDRKYYVKYEVIGQAEKAIAVPTHFFKERFYFYFDY
ncbi:hypothetical protein HDU97_010373 [Phlyctochytrium planicorne]|nr:hypothetical protein HDU97_010373 [Phlyctochytrium planicorne]